MFNYYQNYRFNISRDENFVLVILEGRILVIRVDNINIEGCSRWFGRIALVLWVKKILKRINRVFGELMFTFKESLLTCARISTEKLARVS